jgi:hypothetical protein
MTTASPSAPRLWVLKDILGQLRPEPERKLSPPLRYYEPPLKARYRRRR